MQIKTLSAHPWPTPGHPSAGRPVGAYPCCAAGVASTEETRSACAEMESLFLYHLLREMQSTVPKSGLLGSGTASNLYTDMLHQHLSRELAAGGGIGLAELLMTQLAGGGGPAPDERADEK